MNETQGNGAHCLAGVSRHAALAGNDGHCRQCILVDTRYALDGVDGNNAGGTTFAGCPGNGCHSPKVRSHLGYDGEVRPSAGRRSVAAHQRRVLPHVASHPLACHLRTGEVTLNYIGTRQGGEMGKVCPLLFGLPHDGDDDELVREVLLQAADKVEVLFDGGFRELLHVLEADEGHAVLLHMVEAWRHLLRRIVGYCFETYTCPSCLKSAGAHLIVVCHGRRCQDERVLAAYAAEVDREVGEGPTLVIAGAAPLSVQKACYLLNPHRLPRAMAKA